MKIAKKRKLYEGELDEKFRICSLFIQTPTLHLMQNHVWLFYFLDFTIPWGNSEKVPF